MSQPRVVMHHAACSFFEEPGRTTKEASVRYLFTQGLSSAFFDFQIELTRFFAGIIQFLSFLRQHLSLSLQSALFFRYFPSFLGDLLLLLQNLDPSLGWLYQGTPRVLGEQSLEGKDRLRIVFFGIGRMRQKEPGVVKRDGRGDLTCCERRLIFLQCDIEVRWSGHHNRRMTDLLRSGAWHDLGNFRARDQCEACHRRRRAIKPSASGRFFITDIEKDFHRLIAPFRVAGPFESAARRLNEVKVLLATVVSRLDQSFARIRKSGSVVSFSSFGGTAMLLLILKENHVPKSITVSIMVMAICRAVRAARSIPWSLSCKFVCKSIFKRSSSFMALSKTLSRSCW